MEANSESRVYEQETMQHSDVEASVQDTVEPVQQDEPNASAGHGLWDKPAGRTVF